MDYTAWANGSNVDQDFIATKINALPLNNHSRRHVFSSDLKHIALDGGYYAVEDIKIYDVSDGTLVAGGTFRSQPTSLPGATRPYTLSEDIYPSFWVDENTLVFIEVLSDYLEVGGVNYTDTYKLFWKYDMTSGNISSLSSKKYWVYPHTDTAVHHEGRYSAAKDFAAIPAESKPFAAYASSPSEDICVGAYYKAGTVHHIPATVTLTGLDDYGDLLHTMHVSLSKDETLALYVTRYQASGGMTRFVTTVVSTADGSIVEQFTSEAKVYTTGWQGAWIKDDNSGIYFLDSRNLHFYSFSTGTSTKLVDNFYAANESGVNRYIEIIPDYKTALLVEGPVFAGVSPNYVSRVRYNVIDMENLVRLSTKEIDYPTTTLADAYSAKPYISFPWVRGV